MNSVKGPKREFYRRILPDTCTAFSSEDGKRLFKESLLSGYANIYFPLAEQFCTQSEPAYCGLSTLVMVLNALSVSSCVDYSEAVVRRCSVKKVFLEISQNLQENTFRKIHRKTPMPDSLFKVPVFYRTLLVAASGYCLDFFNTYFISREKVRTKCFRNIPVMSI